MFDIVIIVDWSAANVPRIGRDSIWLCRRDAEGESLVNPPTRHAAKQQLADWLAVAHQSGRKILLGFDFPFGYPAGFAARLGLGDPPWRAVWDEIAGLVEDDQENRNNRFDAAEALNRRISGGGFPFWGRPTVPAREHLGAKHHRRHERDGLAERRLVDLYIPSAQPCWKLLGAGSVGGQALTGIPVARALRNDPRWREEMLVWPFETGLRPPMESAIVMAEVYPSLWAVKPGPDETKDAAQVRRVADYLITRDREGALAGLFIGDPALTPAQRHQVEYEEAWTLGVTAARQRPIPVSAIRSDCVGVDHAGAPHAPESETGQAPTLQPHTKFPSLRPRGRREVGAVGDSGALARGAQLTRPAPQAGPLPLPPKGRRGTNAVDIPRCMHEQDVGQLSPAPYRYLRDPAVISRRSAALVRAEADLTRFPTPLRRVAVRIAHSAGDISILDDLAWSKKAAIAGRQALGAGARILTDAEMVAAGIVRENLAAENTVLCFLRDPAVPEIAATKSITRSAAALELWRPHLDGAVVAIGNAPTALFRLLEILAEGAARPALILGFPVGFVGAAEAKAALADFGKGIEFITLHGRRGGSAIAAAAVNALASRR
jgi:precorrin-8X/cobalt-precorrin-8 methylmutase